MTTTKEQQIEQDFIRCLKDLKYTYRPDIHDREALERNFREKFEALNRVRFTDTDTLCRIKDPYYWIYRSCGHILRQPEDSIT